MSQDQDQANKPGWPRWFREWLAAHMARFPGNNWGDAPEEMFEGWRRAFLRHAITRKEADEASFRCMETRPFPDAMLVTMLTAIREIRGANQPTEVAPAQSLWCDLCRGTGWVAIPPDGRAYAGSACVCGCPAGVLIASRVAESLPRVVHLANRPDLLEWILRDREEREASGARNLESVGADPYGTQEEIVRGLAILARRWPLGGESLVNLQPSEAAHAG